jgi:hypothetical protein
MTVTALHRGSDPGRADADPGRRFDSGISMRAVVRPEALRFTVLRPTSAGPMDLPLLGAAYECWRGVWEETLHDVDGVSNVPSDEFTRQDEIGALFHGWECIGLMGYRLVNLALPMSQDDSYFKVWSEAARSAACVGGPRLFIASNLTVASEWRRAAGHSVKEILLALAIERFLTTDADTAIGTTRNSRGMNDLGYRLGFRPLERDVVHHGQGGDLVAFFRSAGPRLPLNSDTEALIPRLAAELVGRS